VLDEIFQKQLALQIGSFGGDPSQLDQDEKIDYIKSMTLAASDELHEALAEVGWKPWATSRHINRDAYLGELIDVLHFWVNLCLVVGADANEIRERYAEKASRNAKRQAEGYDGVTGKCEACKRALDDIH
jgi:dimeric dUTPase (all-alpha-NTP-PPase superfamily)